MANNRMNRAFLNHPGMYRRPTTDPEHADLMRAFVETLESIATNLDDLGRIVSSRALPMAVTGNVGSVQSALALTVSDRGSSLGSQINISAHTVTHGDVTVTYGAGTLTADDQGADLPYSNGGDEIFYVYVDNASYEDQPTPSYKATDDPDSLTDELGRYYVGTVLMTTDGGGTTYGGGGAGGGTTGDFTIGNPGQQLP